MNPKKLSLLFCEKYSEYGELILKLKGDPKITHRFGEYHKEFCLDTQRSKNDPSWKCFLIIYDDNKIGTIGYFQILNVTKTNKSEYSTPTSEMINSYQRYLNPHEYWIGWFAVLPEFRGRGFSQVSVEKLEQEILKYDSKADRILLNTECDNYRSQGFFKKIGFSKLSTVGEYCDSLDLNIHDHFTTTPQELIFCKNQLLIRSTI